MDAQLHTIRIGVLHDARRDRAGFESFERMVRPWLDDALATGRLDRPVELVHEAAPGLPHGTANAVEEGFANLEAAGVVAVLGPAIGDNALVVTPLAEAMGLPTLNYAGTERARGEYMFHLQVGSHEEEPVILAALLAGRGSRRVVVVRDRGPIGKRYADFFASEAEPAGVRIVGTGSISPVATEVGGLLDELLEARPDALVYLGLGLSAHAVGTALAERGRPVPVVSNAAPMFGHLRADWTEAWEGWVYVDVFADDNEQLAEVRRRLHIDQQAWGPGESYLSDMGRLLAEGLVRADVLSRDGVKDGLERVKLLPAAMGSNGTKMGFGYHDRGAYKGDYLVLRTWRAGRSVEWRP